MDYSLATRLALLLVCATTWNVACTQQVDDIGEPPQGSAPEESARHHDLAPGLQPTHARDSLACDSIEQEEEGDFTPPEAQPYFLRHSIAELPVALLPAWQRADLAPAFERIRDERFQCDPAHPNFARRLTWLAPAVSCEARAELVSAKLAEWGYPRPGKVFVFGSPDLVVSTPNSESGRVSWPWHVAAAVRVGDEAYVFDAALEPRRPLTVLEWASRMAPSVESLTAAVCDAAAFQPSSYCFGEPVSKTRTALAYERNH
ncbi:MAG TPA: protein-glutamine glutaminase family protein, partial [Polyangiaceae bacterium]|nr:protein-glutamine glutaminase family protein [Polyangiaceae bacterium]